MKNTPAGKGKSGTTKVPTFMTKDVGLHQLKALLIWDAMNDSEKFGCKFGMFPAQPMDEAEKEGYNSKLLVHELMHKAYAK